MGKKKHESHGRIPRKYEEETEKPLGRWVQSATTATATARNLKKNKNTIINFWLLLHLFFFLKEANDGANAIY